VIDQIKKGNVEPFRKAFDSLSFDEVCRIYEAVTPHFGPQRHFNLNQFKRAAAAVELSGVVVELGGHDGELAKVALDEFPEITKWYDFDVCEAEELFVHPKYAQRILKDWFHKAVKFEGVYSFVSTHTLEHMSRSMAFDTLDFIANSHASKIIIEMPFKPSGNWNGSKSMHVFKGHQADITMVLESGGWDVVYRGSAGINHTWGAIR
jgi:hypothetical protein